jgi:hypothetical protein
MDPYGFNNKIIACVKNEKDKFEFYNCSIEIYYELWSHLGLEENFQGICFRHAFFNIC